MRILFITSSRIGDAVLSTGLLDHFLGQSRSARATVAAGAAAAPLFAETPGIERMIILRKKKFAGHWFDLWRSAWHERWDVVVDLRASALAYALRAKKRYVASKSDVKEHRLVELGRLVGLDPPPLPKIHVSEKTRERARALVPEGGRVLALGPTANWWGKEWPAGRFLELANRLTAPSGPLPGARVAVLGAGEEREDALPLLEGLPRDRTIDLMGRADLLTAYAVLKRAYLFVGNDSGLMHLAAAARIPTLGLFGPSSEARYGPWGPHARAVRGPRSYEEIFHAPGFDHLARACHMLDLTVDKVEREARAMLEREGPS